MLKKLSILFLVAFLIAACKKNDSPVGIGLLPQTDIIGAKYIEFIPDEAYSTYRKNDSVLPSSRLSNSSLLGSLNDPIFGRTDASIYCSFETNYSSSGLGQIDFGIGPPTLDSAVLVMTYNYQPFTSTIFVGDTSDQLSLDVYPIKYNLNADTTYYTTGNNYYYTTGSTVKAAIPYDESKSLIYGGHSINFTPHLGWFAPIKKDTNVYGPPQLRVRLANEFAEGLFPSTIDNNAVFQQALKGIYITTKHSILPQPSYGSIFFVFMDGNSYINFYYHNYGSPTQVSAAFYCNGGTCNRFSTFKHDFNVASSDLQNQLHNLSDTATPNNNKNLYIQGCAGVGAVLKFPNLLNWINGLQNNITINKAELVLRTDRSNSNFYNLDNYPLPGRLYLEGDTLNGPRGLVEDPYNFGGYYDLTNNLYTIEIPNTVSQLVLGKTKSTKFYLTQYNGALFQERLVITGNQKPPQQPSPVVLRVWYTDLTTKKQH
ncbi:MAG: DUF4270 family protein [Bacteroidia bacterium]